MNSKLSKKLATAYMVLKTINSNPIRIKDLALKLGVNPSTLKALCQELVKGNLIKSSRGTMGGIYIDGPPDFNELLRVLRKGFIFPDSWHEKLTNVFTESYTGKNKKLKAKLSPPCEICNEVGKVLLPEGTCLDCEQYCDRNFLPPKRLAKCGHPSGTRYFNCTMCEPYIDGGILDAYHVALESNQSALQSNTV